MPILIQTIEYTATPVEALEVNNTSPEAIKEPQRDVFTESECSCVKYVRSKIPNLPRGDARDLVTNSFYPVKGGALKLYYGKDGENDVNDYHLVFTEQVTDKGIWVSGDCLKGSHEEYREFIPFGDRRIMSWWHPFY